MRKLKNPERYIKRLKQKVAWLEKLAYERSTQLFTERGKHWLTMQEGSEYSIIIHGDKYGDMQSGLRIGRPLRIEAEIAEYHATKEEITVTMGLKTVRVLGVTP